MLVNLISVNCEYYRDFSLQVEIFN